MKLRLVLAAGLVGAMSFAGMSNAAAKAVCNQVVDDKGDGTAFLVAGNPAGQNDPAWDIVTADIATDAKNLTTVIRVDKLATSTSNSPTGLGWRFDFTPSTGGQVFTQARSHPVGGVTFTAGYINAQGTSTSYPVGTATGALDEGKNEVRVTVPLAAFAEQAVIKNGTKIGTLNPSAGRFYSAQGGNPSLSEQSDSAEGAKTYTAGTRTCVAVGK